LKLSDRSTLPTDVEPDQTLAVLGRITMSRLGNPNIAWYLPPLSRRTTRALTNYAMGVLFMLGEVGYGYQAAAHSTLFGGIFHFFNYYNHCLACIKSPKCQVSEAKFCPKAATPKTLIHDPRSIRCPDMYLKLDFLEGPPLLGYLIFKVKYPKNDHFGRPGTN